jgi:hypothetical protein
MARKFTESFDMQSLDQLGTVSDVAIISSSLGGGDFALQLTGFFTKNFATAEAENYYGFYLQPNAGGWNSAHKQLAWLNGLTILGTLKINDSGKMEAYVGTGGGETLVGTGTVTWSAGQGKHVQARVLIANGGGVIQVKADGVLDIDFSGDTQPGSETEIDGIHMNNTSAVAAMIVNNNSGTKDNGFPGVVRMRGRKPDKDGFYNEFDREPASPTTAFDKVDDSGTPDTADFVSTDVNLEAQSLRFPSHGLIRADVKAVNYLYYMRKIASGQATHGTRKIATEANIFDAAPINLSTSFRTERFRYTENPHTALPWVLEDAQDDRFESIIQSLV